MKTIYLFAVLAAFSLAACGESNTSGEETGNTQEAEATAEDMQLIEETKSVKMKAHEATAKADSILNTL